MSRPHLIIPLFLLFAPAHAADIAIYGAGGNWCTATITGKIESGDDERFRAQLVDRLQSNTCSGLGILYAYSPGGDVHAAIGIGEQLRVLETQTFGPIPYGPLDAPSDGKRWCNWLEPRRRATPAYKQRIIMYNPRSKRGDARCSCMSACFFIWAGGASRHGHAIGLHRPYFDPRDFANLDTKQASEQYSSAMRFARDYLNRMNVPTPIVDKMFSVDSHNVKYLSWDEAQLLAELPYLEELLLARCPKEVDTATRWSSMCVWNVVADLWKQAAKRYLSKYGTRHSP